MASVPIKVTVNGVEHSSEIEPRLLLVHYLRETLRLTGTHIGCDTSHCGACTVVMDGRAVKSCTVFAIQADGREVLTVEGLEQDGKLHPLQEGFFQEHGLFKGAGDPRRRGGDYGQGPCSVQPSLYADADVRHTDGPACGQGDV